MGMGLDALFGGGGGGGGGGFPPSGGAQGGAQGKPGVAEDADFRTNIQTAIDALHAAQKTGEDDTDKALAAKCMSELQNLLGTHQKQQDAAMGISDVHRGVRRAVRGAGARGAAGGGGGGAYGG